ncbi:unnamed protein product [marine sediment metagenome]|uniref:Uncharacterized protein n=1 Tax=marine sediment metagenome TaxID=412755 RepID=X0VUV5_9ZZZZ
MNKKIINPTHTEDYMNRQQLAAAVSRFIAVNPSVSRKEAERIILKNSRTRSNYSR